MIYEDIEINNYFRNAENDSDPEAKIFKKWRKQLWVSR